MKNPSTRPLRLLPLALLAAMPLAHASLQIAQAERALLAERLPNDPSSEMRWVEIAARDKFERSKVAGEGVSIEAVRSTSVWGFATKKKVAQLKAQGFKILGDFKQDVARGGHETGFGTMDFPVSDARFHNYAETVAMLRSLNSKHADITKLVSIGKSLEGRDIWAFHINTSEDAIQSGRSTKPGAIFMGNHHAREHLSNEIPLLFIDHLLANRTDARIGKLLDERDIWIIPIVNPDGVEWDISTGRYKMWRKNRHRNADGSFGVDLNRNYGFMWGTGGSDKDPTSDVYMGEQPFSEPETQVIRDFVEAHLNAKVLLTVHTFSELILYPWGHKHESISKGRDLAVFEKMAKTMAQWNRYTPEQSSDLYIASGDTTDWAYGAHGIFAFTFELSPKSQWEGGFYPGAGVIDRVFNDNLQPMLYLLETAADPYAVVEAKPTPSLENYHVPALPEAVLKTGNPRLGW